MRSGIVYGTASMLDGIIDRIREEFHGKEVSIVATGGSAPFIVKFCHNPIVYDKTLLMKGLWAIYKKESIKAKRPHLSWGVWLLSHCSFLPLFIKLLNM